MWILNESKKEQLGFLTVIFDPTEELPYVDQANQRYAHGGGWRDFEGFTIDPDSMSLVYPDDPPIKCIGTLLGKPDEIVAVYEHSWVAVISTATNNPNDGARFCRMD